MFWVKKYRPGNHLVNDDLESWLYDPVDNTYSDNIAGWNDQVWGLKLDKFKPIIFYGCQRELMLIGNNFDNQLELDDDGEEEEDNRKVVTLARSFLILSFRCATRIGTKLYQIQGVSKVYIWDDLHQQRQ